MDPGRLYATPGWFDKSLDERTITVSLETFKGAMSQPDGQKPPGPSPRKRTPRVPSNVLYDRVVPIALVIMALVLIAVVAVAVAGLIGVFR